ncbi:hypothetical protein EOI86_18640 [Hwanghaeella grinnelliae]|uniref:Uncharacterized protein n=1 Tax=Hwanghaeella grinnelliae TaxID=2500179 RepID=A0A437QK18_9PROT|nr:hypothetical protein EOI86_18640 [Hwanghaeella grinnelliae]
MFRHRSSWRRRSLGRRCDSIGDCLWRRRPWRRARPRRAHRRSGAAARRRRIRRSPPTRQKGIG